MAQRSSVFAVFAFIVVGAMLFLSGCSSDSSGIDANEAVSSPTVALSQLVGWFSTRFNDVDISFDIERVDDGYADVEMGVDYNYERGIIFEVARNTFVAHIEESGEGSIVMVLVAEDKDSLRWVVRSMNGDSYYFATLEEEIVLRRR